MKSLVFSFFFCFVILTVINARNYSLNFDGVDDYGIIPNNVAYNLEDFSILFYLKAPESTNARRELISRDADPEPPGGDWTILIEEDGRLGLNVRKDPSGYAIIQSISKVDDNEWHHIAITRSATSGLVTMYIDGSNEGTDLGPTGLMFNDVNINIGRHSELLSLFYDGLMDDISIWNFELSSSEVQSYVFTSFGGSESGLIGYWDFNEGTGDIVHDASNNHNHGTIHGAVWSTDFPHPPTGPVVSDIPDQIITHKFVKYDLDEYVTDPDHRDCEIRWTFSGNTDLTIKYQSKRRVVKIFAPNKWNGSETITFTATDPDGQFDSDQATISALKSSLGNHPNPFNPSTKIEFDLTKSEFVTLEVFNLLGQKITTLLEKEMDMGHHEIQFDGSNFPSGVYFYSIKAGNLREIKKMILMK